MFNEKIRTEFKIKPFLNFADVSTYRGLNQRKSTNTHLTFPLCP